MPRSRSVHPLIQLAQSSSRPVYLVDEQRCLASCNPACCEWLGMSEDELVGQRCDYASPELAERAAQAAAALCPPPSAFLGSFCQGEVFWRTAAGSLEARPASFLPLHHEETAPVLVVLGEPHPSDPSRNAAREDATAEALHHQLQASMQQLRAGYRLDQIVGNDPAIRRVREQIATAIAARARTVIIGPPGTGREHLARTILYGAGRPDDSAILPLNCPLLDAESLAATLDRSVAGGLNQKPSAWLLLDVDLATTEVHETLANRLREPGLDVQVLATARRPLLGLASDGSFHAELAYALSTLVIELPALRQRRGDIPLLVQRLVEEHNLTAGRQLAGFSPAALDRLASLPWNGNDAELRAVVQDACQAVSTVWIGETDLPARVRAVVSAGLHPRHESESIRLDDFLLEIEKELIERAMGETQGNKSHAARLLGVSRQRLIRRLEQLGLVTRDAVTAIDFQPEEEVDNLHDSE